MTKYKCGHETDGVLVLDDNPLSLTAYFEWKDSVGWNGDKSECFDCWNNQREKR
jgi:hypothetical protein